MSTMYQYHHKYGYRKKREKKETAVIVDGPPPRVSVTANKDIMDELGGETGARRPGVFLQVLLQDWVLEETKKRRGNYQ